MPRTKKAYDAPASDEWVQPVVEGYKLACCDCGLVHELDFRIHENGKIQFRARRNNRATSTMRYWKAKKREGLALYVGKETKRIINQAKLEEGG